MARPSPATAATGGRDPFSFDEAPPESRERRPKNTPVLCSPRFSPVATLVKREKAERRSNAAAERHKPRLVFGTFVGEERGGGGGVCFRSVRPKEKTSENRWQFVVSRRLSCTNFSFFLSVNFAERTSPSREPMTRRLRHTC